MIPQYQFNLSNVDPTLMDIYSDPNYVDNIDKQIEKMQMLKQNIQNNVQNPVNVPTKQTHPTVNYIWDDIDREVGALTNSQKEVLFGDKEYAENEYRLQSLVQAELINLVKGKIQQTKEGKELLDKQLSLVKDKKKEIVANSDKEVEVFKKFQIAAQANPNLTYKEFCENINK
jgi:hypothetical protein